MCGRIKELILDREVDEYGRRAGLTALAFLAEWADVPGRQVIDCFLWLAHEGRNEPCPCGSGKTRRFPV
jgi:hypothetical protein